jgi:mycothiol synthase
MSAGMLRPFENRDYPRLAAIGVAIEPTHARDVDSYQRLDRARQPRERHLRLVWETQGQVVAAGEVGHMWWGFHPHKFGLWLNVDPPWQGRGIGARLYDALLDTLATWQPLAVRSETRETRPRSLRFLADRGFVEIHRRWESRLVLDRARLVDAPSVASIRLVTLAAERALRGDAVVRELYELETLAGHDEPAADPDGVMQFEQFVSTQIDSPNALPEANFLAFEGEHLVGVSRLSRDSGQPGTLHVGFTGVHPMYRGRGIATALKLRTLEYARREGFHEILTQNDTTNTAMLHINAALGFETEPAWIIFEKRFAH